MWKISHKSMSYKMRDVHKRKATVSSHSLGSSCDGGNSVTVHLVVFRHLKKPFLVHATLSPHSSYSQLICQQSKRDWSIKVIQQAKKKTQQTLPLWYCSSSCSHSRISPDYSLSSTFVIALY